MGQGPEARSRAAKPVPGRAHYSEVRARAAAGSDTVSLYGNRESVVNVLPRIRVTQSAGVAGLNSSGVLLRAVVRLRGSVLGKQPEYKECVGATSLKRGGERAASCGVGHWNISLYGLARGERSFFLAQLASRAGLWGGRGASAPLTLDGEIEVAHCQRESSGTAVLGVRLEKTSAARAGRAEG